MKTLSWVVTRSGMPVLYDIWGRELSMDAGIPCLVIKGPGQYRAYIDPKDRRVIYKAASEHKAVAEKMSFLVAANEQRYGIVLKVNGESLDIFAAEEACDGLQKVPMHWPVFILKVPDEPRQQPITPWHFLGNVRMCVTKDRNGVVTQHLQINDKGMWRAFNADEKRAWENQFKPAQQNPLASDDQKDGL